MSQAGPQLQQDQHAPASHGGGGLVGGGQPAPGIFAEGSTSTPSVIRPAPPHMSSQQRGASVNYGHGRPPPARQGGVQVCRLLGFSVNVI